MIESVPETISYKQVKVNWDGHKYGCSNITVILNKEPEYNRLEPDMILLASLTQAPTLNFVDDLVFCNIWVKHPYKMETDLILEKVSLPDGRYWDMELREIPRLTADLNRLFELEGDDRIVPISYFRPEKKGEERFRNIYMTLRGIKRVADLFPSNISLFLTKRAGKQGPLSITPSVSSSSIQFPNKYETPHNLEIVEVIRRR